MRTFIYAIIVGVLTLSIGLYLLVSVELTEVLLKHTIGIIFSLFIIMYGYFYGIKLSYIPMANKGMVGVIKDAIKGRKAIIIGKVFVLTGIIGILLISISLIRNVIL